MSILNKKIDSASIKKDLIFLLENLDKNNASKIIIERYYKSFCELAINEDKIKINEDFNKSSDRPSVESNSILVYKIAKLNSLVNELSSYKWMDQISTFINETSKLLKENEIAILIEQVIYDLESSNSKSYYKSAVETLRKISKNDNQVNDLVNEMEAHKWIPLIKRLHEHAITKRGEYSGENPNFTISKIHSPIDVLSENVYGFVSSGILLEYTDSSLKVSDKLPSNNFISLYKITENCKFTAKGIRIYPNTKSFLDIEVNENEAVIKLNNKILKSEDVNSHLFAGGYVKMNETNKIAFIEQAIKESHKIKEIDLGYRISSNLFEGVCANIFTIGDKLYIQKVNHAMKQNELIEAETSSEGIQIVKDFINYDITNSVSSLLENETNETIKISKETDKIESRIKFLNENLNKLNDADQNNPKIVKATKFLLDKINEQKAELECILAENNL